MEPGSLEHAPRLQEALAAAWRAYRQQPVWLSAVVAVHLAITLALLLAAYVNIVFLLLVFAPWMGGLLAFLLRALGGEAPRLADLTAGFKRWELCLGALGMLAFHMVLLCVPLYAAAYVSTFGFDAATRMTLLAAGGSASAVLVVAGLLRWIFVLPLAADTPKRVAMSVVFEHSARMTLGLRVRLGAQLFALPLLAISGALVAGAGLLVTLPLALLAFASLYRAYAERTHALIPPDAPDDWNAEYPPVELDGR